MNTTLTNGILQGAIYEKIMAMDDSYKSRCEVYDFVMQEIQISLFALVSATSDACHHNHASNNGQAMDNYMAKARERFMEFQRRMDEAPAATETEKETA